MTRFVSDPVQIVTEVRVRNRLSGLSATAAEIYRHIYGY